MKLKKKNRNNLTRIDASTVLVLGWRKTNPHKRHNFWKITALLFKWRIYCVWFIRERHKLPRYCVV